MQLERAYPGLAFSSRSRNWWAWLTGAPAECIHLHRALPWMATLLPDTLYVRGKAVHQREPVRPEVSLCRECFLHVLEPELAAFQGRVVAFDPNPSVFTQYFCIAPEDFDCSGVEPTVAAAIEKRLSRQLGKCEKCNRDATWQWIPREQVSDLDDVEKMTAAPGENLCARHGAERLCAALESIAEINLYYVNVPYGESGAYLWI